MAPNPRVLKAFSAMNKLGIATERVRPVLKKLLLLYDENWELIEEGNYRALADAIFDDADDKVLIIRCFRTFSLHVCVAFMFLCRYPLGDMVCSMYLVNTYH